MVKTAGDIEFNMVTNLINQKLIEEVILEEWEFRKIVNCYKLLCLRKRKL